jgi:hypothetical protein
LPPGNNFVGFAWNKAEKIGYIDGRKNLITKAVFANLAQTGKNTGFFTNGIDCFKLRVTI